MILCSGTGDAREFVVPYDERHTPVALAGMVTASLKLPPLALAPVNVAARKDYDQGLLDTRVDSKSAVGHLNRAVTEDPDSALAAAALADAFWLQYYRNGRHEDDLEQSKHWLRVAESLDPDVPAAHRVEGVLYYNDALYGKAQAELKRAMQLEPDNAPTRIWLAKAYEDNNEPDLAREQFQKATEVEPGYFRGWENLAAYYEKRSDFREAASDMAKAVALAPDAEKPRERGFLGSYCAFVGNWDASERELRISLGQKETVNARYQLGLTLMYEQKEREAIQEFEQSLRLIDLNYNSRNAPPYLIRMHMGIAYTRLHEDAKARAAYQQGLSAAKNALEANYQDGYINAFLGFFYAALHQPDMAAEEIEKSRSAFREHADVRWRAALTYEELYRLSHEQRFRDKTMEVLRDAPPQQLADLSRWPDVEDLQRDPQFLSLLLSRPVLGGGDVCQ
jgi:tetratricopeptide (TPR) repeat protein